MDVLVDSSVWIGYFKAATHSTRLDALLDKIRKAPEFLQFMTELKETVDGYRREFEGR